MGFTIRKERNRKRKRKRRKKESKREPFFFFSFWIPQLASPSLLLASLLVVRETERSEPGLNRKKRKRRRDDKVWLVAKREKRGGADARTISKGAGSASALALLFSDFCIIIYIRE